MLLSKRHSAFTLIELLVVIAIIAILARILFPVFAQARATAQNVVCASDKRQMGIAMIMYRDDFAQRWMPAFGGGAITDWAGYDHQGIPVYFTPYPQSGQLGKIRPIAKAITPGFLDRYVKSIAVYRCPRRPGKGSQSLLALNGWSSGGSSYGPEEFSPFVAGYDNNGHTYGAKDSQLEEPSYTILLWEHYVETTICTVVQSGSWCKVIDPLFNDHFKYVHRYGSIILFADSHAKMLSMGQLHRAMFSVNKSNYRRYPSLAAQNYCH